MSYSRQWRAGDLVGVVYEFAAGEGLAMHNHSDLDVHITIVTRGAVRISGPQIGERVFRADDSRVVDFAAYQPHEITALEGGAAIVNILKKMHNGKREAAG